MKLSNFFYPNQSKANKKNGNIPIYMRLMLNRQKAEMRLNAEVSETECEEWDTNNIIAEQICGSKKDGFLIGKLASAYLFLYCIPGAILLDRDTKEKPAIFFVDSDF